jgi:hypothetical protein
MYTIINVFALLIKSNEQGTISYKEDKLKESLQDILVYFFKKNNQENNKK